MDILQVLRALLIEYKLDAKEWPYLLPIVQASVNHTPVDSLGQHSPIELFLGLPAQSALDMVAAKVDEETAVRPGNIGDDTTEYPANLRESLQVMHQTVVDRKGRKRLQVRARSKAPPCNFDVGDYVLG
ncbi:hypothetical protein PC129_g23142 [Phytophthora cactorum]|uniref:Integrase catalytic domain-containing protein n=1 Tax=Phytophthora cactorum TaxID=29920 RepID=A0A329S8P3_9STRA|nr:hypothetical protein Pcac1_g13189 [Phytophthora cactorum]KAG2792734.1 hypothetical protein PC111_g23337 [Phytophthora cactorum]KAG2793006.1 hypothetical protein PC112_g23628 [Phytophthora cactorum]KAG2813156.1 hypothetical protein PC113_g23475 [Phytophthora cactorum]KAG2872491.1 hypothetical protein PC114_g26351 [Phytophthora cactorum]